jgi:hypothetical protein
MLRASAGIQRGGRMRRLISLILVVCPVVLARSAFAGQLGVTAMISAVTDGPNFDYTIDLKNLNSSTDSVETFWFAWTPMPVDFLPTSRRSK